MGERKVVVVIDPPEPGRCNGCRWHRHIGPVFRHTTYCGLRIEVDPYSDVRPAACIAAEAEAQRLAEDAHEWRCEQNPVLCDEPGCDREVSCGWPQGDGVYRQTCSEHWDRAEPLGFPGTARREQRDRVTDALAAVLC